MTRTWIAVLLVAALSGAAVAALPVPTVPGTVFVHALNGVNTTSTAGTYISTDASGSPPNFVIDNLWYHPWDTSSWSSTAGVSNDPYTEDAPMITTTAPAALNPAGTYDVYVYYIAPGWATAPPAEGVVARLPGGSWQTRNNANSTLLGQISDGNRPMYESHLGQVTGVSSLAVDIDDDNTQVGWVSYVGIGYNYQAQAPHGTVVNATSGNTVGAVDPWFTVPPDYSQNDNKWTLWGGDTWLAYGGLTGQFGAGENAPMLTTTATGLDPGRIYDVYVLLLGDSPTTNGIQAAISGDTLQTYMLEDSLRTTLGAHGGNVQDRPVYEAKIGQVQGVSEVSIDVDDDQANFFSCIYYGLAYEDVGAVPEPCTLGLLGIGGLFALRRRRS